MTIAPLYHRPTKSILLHVDDPFQVREVIPNSRVVQHTAYNLAVQYTVDTAKMLRNLGHTVPSPMQVNYTWPGKYAPWEHQRVMAEFCTMHKRCFNLSEMGTGKSAATLWAADYLMQTKQVRRVLIICPLSTMQMVWTRDIFDVLMHRVASVVHGSRQSRLDALSEPADFYILNHDGVSIDEVAALIRRTPEIDLVVLDEGSMFRNNDTRKYKALAKMLRADMRLWWLTATPCPNAPTDAWSQIKLVNPSRVSKFFGTFKRSTMMQVSTFKWVPKPDAYTTVYDAMQPAIRFKKSECLDLPPVTFENRQADLTPEQTKAFNTMKNAMQAEAKTTKITAVNAADKISKLRQILCGAIKDPQTGTYITIPHGPRVNVVLELIEQASAKVLVIVPFKGIITALQAEIEKHHSVAVLNGDVSRTQRDRIIHEFKSTAHPRVLLCHPKVMSHGLNLTEADTLIFYAPIYSNDEAQQVTERFNRAGQKNKMTVVKVAAHPLEWEIYKLLDSRKITQDSILTLYRTITE
jgi:SNF2 family DNA or RNA helicase